MSLLKQLIKSGIISQIQIITIQNYEPMKRSTTPAIKEKTSMVKSNANLKVASQLKIVSKDVKKTLYSKISSTNHQNSTLQKRQSTSKLSSLNNSYTKKFSTYAKYLGQNSNPETQCSSPQLKQKQNNLTAYLISKSWQNSAFILSSQVNQQMKKLVVEWLIELSHYIKLKRETLYHTMWIFERCLQKITDLNAKNLQLLAITCLFMSTKYEEIYPPKIMDLIEKTMNSYHKKQVIQLQQKILAALNFELTAPNRYTFVNLSTNTSKYLEQYDKDTIRLQPNTTASNYPNQKRYTDFLNYILELTLLKSFPDTYSEKEIADAVIYLANKVMKRQESFIDQDDWLYLTKIQQIAYEIIQIWKENKNSIVSFLYDCDKWSFVGGLTILF